MRILGISAYYHDSSAALISDENGSVTILAAAQEERFSRKKFDSSFPLQAIQFCLAQGKLKFSEIDAVVYYEKPWITFERLLETHLAFAPKGLWTFLAAMPAWLSWKLNIKKTLQKEFAQHFGKESCRKISFLFSSHHLSHAAAAFFASPFNESAVLCMDGVGEWETTTLWKGEKNRLEMILKIEFPHSLGLLYSAFTYFCGFKVNSGEYKLMGLAPYGKPIFVEKIKNLLIDIKEDGSFRLDLSYFDYTSGFEMTSVKFSKLFECEPRQPDDPIRQIDMDMAASIQRVTEEVVERLAITLKNQTKSRMLSLSGGVALNCVANGKLQKKKIFDEIWIQPAAGDAGSALGAALGAYFIHYKNPREAVVADLMQGGFLGSQYSDELIEAEFLKNSVQFTKFDSAKAAASEASKYLADSQVIGFFQGRMEYGPRALGARSILGDARVPDMQKRMNLKIKFRESFRPFAPAVLFENQNEIFETADPSPYMLITTMVRKELLNQFESSSFGLQKINEIRSAYPAITHVDCSARIQSVQQSTNPLFHFLISEFKQRTGSPVVINTSFNVRGEPIVESPLQAINCFLNTDIDVLCIGSYLAVKAHQNHPMKASTNWSSNFERD